HPGGHGDLDVGGGAAARYQPGRHLHLGLGSRRRRLDHLHGDRAELHQQGAYVEVESVEGYQGALGAFGWAELAARVGERWRRLHGEDVVTGHRATGIGDGDLDRLRSAGWSEPTGHPGNKLGRRRRAHDLGRYLAEAYRRGPDIEVGAIECDRLVDH